MKSDAQGHRQRAGGRVSYTPLALGFPGPLVDAIDAIVADRVDGPSRSAVIRELLAEALEARAARAASQLARVAA